MFTPEQISKAACDEMSSKIISMEDGNTKQILLDIALKAFEGVLEYRKPYEFVEESEEEAKIKGNYSDVPEFQDDGSFSELLKWFKNFDKFAKSNRLSSRRVLMMVKNKVKPLNMKLEELIPEGKKVSNMHELQMVVINHIYYSSEAFSAMYRLYNYKSQSQNIYVIIKEFKDLCYEVVVAMKAFNSPVIVDPKQLIVAFINNLPLEIRILCRSNFYGKASIKIIDVIDFVETVSKEIRYTPV